MEARLLTKFNGKPTHEQIQDFIIGCTQGLFELEIFFNGFYYEPNEGIYLVGPRSELEKVKNENGVEDFDFSAYINANPGQPFWLMDWWSDIDNPRLMEYKK